MNPTVKDCLTVRIDAIALCGYRYAAGTLPKMPRLFDQLDIDAFNAGIANFNHSHDTFIPKLVEGMKIISSGPSGTADKELAIAGGQS